MKLIQRYVLSQLLRNLVLCMMIVVFLFVVFDFFDHIDNIVAEDASAWLAFEYFAFKIPLTVSLMLPIATMAAILLTIGVMSKNSEITAMRASGVTVRWIAAPVFMVGLILSLSAIALNETIVPYAQRRATEIYNIDIRRKDQSGGYSQSNFWWRSRNSFYSVGTFDSRTNSLLDMSILELGSDFRVHERTDTQRATWVHDGLGWNMQRIDNYRFTDNGSIETQTYKALPLPIAERPADFFDARTDPSTMTYRQLKSFVKKQAQNGLAVAGYKAYLYEKLSFPFITFIVSIVVLPFALKPARSGSMTTSIIAAMLIGFSYYAIHSFSIALGRAEFFPPLLSAWMANILMGFAGSVLMLGSEAP